MPKGTEKDAEAAPAAAQGQDEGETGPEVIDVNRDIPCEIFGHKTGRLAGSPTPRVYLTLTFDAVIYARLSGLLGANLKGQIRIHVVDIQAPLPDEDDEEEDNADERAQLRLENAPRIGEVSHMVDGVGQAFKKHGFAPSSADKDKCAVCTAGKSHPVHEGQKMTTARNARKSEALMPHPYKGREERAVCVYCDRMENDEIHDPAKWNQPSPINSDAFPNGAAPSTETPEGEELPRYYQRVAYWLEHEATGDPLMANELAEEDVKNGHAQPKTPADEHNLQELEAEREKFLAERPPLTDEELTDEQREARAALAARSAT